MEVNGVTLYERIVLHGRDNRSLPSAILCCVERYAEVNAASVGSIDEFGLGAVQVESQQLFVAEINVVCVGTIGYRSRVVESVLLKTFHRVAREKR